MLSGQAGTSDELAARYEAELLEHFSTDQVGPLSVSEARFVARKLVQIRALTDKDHEPR